MKEFNSINDILDFAINAEQEAVNFYTSLADHSKNAAMKKVFIDFAQEEMKHKSMLMGIKEHGKIDVSDLKIKDLKIADYLVSVKPTAGMTYEEALILAMQKEKKAFMLYMNLSEKAEEPSMKKLFLSLAQEESRHKLRFELEYDEYILREN
jgi:rubrerythrin